KEYNVRSNISIGEWDVDLLLEHFADFDFEDLGLDLEFELPDEIMQEPEEEKEFEPELPEEPKTTEGDVYELISPQKDLVHRIVCGDSRSAETYKKLLLQEKFQMIVTDPPYNVDYLGKTKKKLKIQNDKMTPEEFYSFL